MVTFFEALIWIFILIIIGTIYWYMTIPKNLPPGPIGLPLIGSALDYWDGSRQHLVLQENVKTYGPLFKLYIANKLVVVLGDYDMIQEATVKQGDLFSGRPQIQGIQPEKYSHLGVINSEGHLWKEQRRFALSTLRDFGVGRPIIEPKIKEELECLIEEISKHAQAKTSFDPHILLTCAVSNIINGIIFGRRFSYHDEKITKQFISLSRRASGSGIAFLSPFILTGIFTGLINFIPEFKRFKRETDEFMEFVANETEKTAATFDPEADSTNFIHSFLKAGRESKDFDNYFTDLQLHATVNDLFGAGAETTSTTLRWAILFLAQNPEIQEKIYREINEQVGVSALPDYGDKTKLPFTEAVVMETQRLANLVPSGVPRRTLGPTKLMGYDIPEDTVVMSLLTNVLHNPDLYPNPLKFDPTRFLDANGKVVRDPKLIPFQAGKRICLGEPLARLELFLMLAGLVSQFRFYFPSDQPVPVVKPMVGFTCAPDHYQVFAEARND